MEDEELLRQMAEGRSAPLELLVHRYHRPLYAYLYRMLGSKPLAEDAVQECFLRLMETVRRGKLPPAFRPWLYRIAANLCKDGWRRASSRLERSDEERIRGQAAQDSVLSLLEKQQEREEVVRALGQLDPEKRSLVVLRFYQELKLQEIADVLELPLSTVKSRLYQSLRELQRMLAPEQAGAPSLTASGRLNPSPKTRGRSHEA